MTFQSDKRWSDRFMRKIKSLIGQVLLSEAPDREDKSHNTDLVVFKMNSVRIGCRIRRHEYKKYYGQFTIRAGRPSGAKTELAKIIEGWGDFFFYGFASVDGETVSDWWLCDLNVFRLWFMRQIYKCQPLKMPGEIRNNQDNSSSFVAFNMQELPAEFVVASSRDGIEYA